MNVEDIAAIDMHVHVEQDGHGRLALDRELMDASAGYFSSDADRTPRVADIAAYYRQRNMIAVVFTVDAHTATGHPALSSAEVIEEASGYADTLIPFASVDPHDGDIAVSMLEELAGLGARGLKLHPSLQSFAPNDERFYPLYRKAQHLGLPIVFHTGQTGIGAGLPGGRGIKLRYSNPMLIDDVAADFPELNIVLAHPSVPWQDEAISIATHKSNVFIDLSGWSPKYFPTQLVRAAAGRLRHKMLFGSDYPVLSPDRWLKDVEPLDIPAEAMALIMKENARRLLSL